MTGLWRGLGLPRFRGAAIVESAAPIRLRRAPTRFALPLGIRCRRRRPMTSSNRRPAEIAKRSARALAQRADARDAFRRETFALPREAARAKAREFFQRFPKAAYMTEIESWRDRKSCT